MACPSGRAKADLLFGLSVLSVRRDLLAAITPLPGSALAFRESVWAFPESALVSASAFPESALELALALALALESEPCLPHLRCARSPCNRQERWGFGSL
jgi:hypothetical protein